MSKDFSENPHSHPLNHRLFRQIDRRLNRVCAQNGVDRSTGLFNFVGSTILRPWGHEGRRIRPVYFGDLTHFINDSPATSTPVLQIDLQEKPDDEPSLVTYVIPAEAPMLIIDGEVLDATRWDDLCDIALRDIDRYLQLQGILPNILFEMSDTSIANGSPPAPLGTTTLGNIGQSMF